MAPTTLEIDSNYGYVATAQWKLRVTYFRDEQGAIG